MRQSYRALALLVVTAFAILLVLAAWQAKDFKVDASAETLLTKNNRHYLIAQQAGQRYGSEEFILVAFKPDEGSVFSRNNLETVEALSNDLRKLDRVEAVRSLVNVPLFTALESFEDDVDLGALTWQSQRYPPQEFEKRVSNHPLYEGLLFNEEKTALGVQIVFDTHPRLIELQAAIVELETHLLDRELTEEEQSQLDQLRVGRSELEEQLNAQRAEEIEKIRAITADYEHAGDFYLGGAYLLVHQLIEIIKNDLYVFGAAITLIVCVILFLLFRRLRWVALPMVCCATSVVLTLGLLGLLQLKVTVISANVIALQIILTLALIIHLIVQYQELGEHPDQVQRVRETLKYKAKPSFFAGLTTSIGFGSLLISGVQPVISFGWMMMLAMLVTLLVSLLLFPALLMAFSRSNPEPASPKFIERGIGAGARLVTRRPLPIVALCALVLVAGLLGCLRLSAENSFLNYFADDTEVYRELSFIDQEFGGSTPFDVLYTVPESQRNAQLLMTADAIQTLGKIQHKLQQKEGIGNITSLYDFSVIAATVAGKPVTEYELTALYKTLDPALRDQLLSGYFSKEANQLRISARIQDSTPGLDRASLLQSVRDDLAELGIEQEQYTLTGLFVLYEDILSRLVKSQFSTLGLVYLVMGVILLAIFRSLKVALICLVPNLVTTAAILGTMGLAGIPMDLMTITIAAVAMGISVDGTIHYVHRYQEELQTHPAQAIERTHSSVGYAMVYTTIIIVVGFSALVFSDFVPSVMFGLLTAVAMIVALLTDLTILPVLLHRFVKAGKVAQPADPHCATPPLTD